MSQVLFQVPHLGQANGFQTSCTPALLPGGRHADCCWALLTGSGRGLRNFTPNQLPGDANAESFEAITLEHKACGLNPALYLVLSSPAHVSTQQQHRAPCP